MWRRAEFRALVLAFVLSTMGDNLARIALAIVFYERTHSPFVAALTFSLSFLPSLVAGPLLSTLGDKFERRRVMVVCDVCRAILITTAAGCVLLGWPPAAAISAVLAAALFSPAFDASRAALIPQVVAPHEYMAASVVTGMVYQLTQIVSFLAGAAAVAVIGGAGALLIDAATFLASAIVLILFVHRRPPVPASHPAEAAAQGMVIMMRVAAVEVWSRPVLRSLLTVAAISVTGMAVPEGLAVVYASRHGLTGVAQGAMVAAIPAGLAIGGVLMTKFVSAARRPVWIRPCALVAPVPLLFTGLPLPAVAVFVLWTVAGLLMAFQFAANAAFVLHTPEGMRSRAMGLAQSALTLATVVGLLAGGALAAIFDVRYVVAGGAALTIVALLRPALRWPAEFSQAAAGLPTGAPLLAQGRGADIGASVMID